MDLSEVLRNYGAASTPVTEGELVSEFGPVGSGLAKNLDSVRYIPPPEGYPTPLRPDEAYIGYGQQVPGQFSGGAPVAGLNSRFDNEVPQNFQRYLRDSEALGPVNWQKVGEPFQLQPGQSAHFDTGPEAADTVGHELMHSNEHLVGLADKMADKNGLPTMDVQHYMIQQLQNYNDTGKGELAGLEYDMGAVDPATMSKQDYIKLRGTR